MSLKQFIITVFTLFMCVSYGMPFSVNAQQIDLSISPPKLEALIKPDTQLSIPYTITNRGDSLRIKPLIRTFSVSRQRDAVVYNRVTKAPIKFSFVDENSETIETILVNKGESKKIYLQLDVSAAAAEGDYQLSFLAETQPEFLDKQFSSRIKSQIASPLLVTITKTGRTQIRGAISEFEIVGKFFDSFDTVPIRLVVKNKGKNAMNAEGSITVRGSFGEKATYELQSQNIVAGSERQMRTKSTEDSATLGLKGFFMGRYGVSASIALADGTIQLNKSTSFFAFPFKIILIAAFSALIGIMMLKKKR